MRMPREGASRIVDSINTGCCRGFNRQTETGANLFSLNPPNTPMFKRLAMPANHKPGPSCSGEVLCHPLIVCRNLIKCCHFWSN